MTEDDFWYDDNVGDGGVTPHRPKRGAEWNYSAPTTFPSCERPFTWSVHD